MTKNNTWSCKEISYRKISFLVMGPTRNLQTEENLSKNPVLIGTQMHTKAEEDHMKLKRRGWVIESHQIFDTHFNFVWYFYGDRREMFFYTSSFSLCLLRCLVAKKVKYKKIRFLLLNHFCYSDFFYSNDEPHFLMFIKKINILLTT